MEKAPLNGISAFIATGILAIFVIALAESISAGFAGFWGGLPFWMIIIFVLYLAVYNFFEETFGLSDKLKFVLQVTGILYSGLAFAFGSWQASSYVEKFGDDATFSFPFSSTEIPMSQGFMMGFWVAVTVLFVVLTSYAVLKHYRNYQNT